MMLGLHFKFKFLPYGNGILARCENKRFSSITYEFWSMYVCGLTLNLGLASKDSRGKTSVLVTANVKLKVSSTMLHV